VQSNFDFSGLSLALIRDAIIGKDLAGNIVHWNVDAERMFGFRESEIIGKNIETIIPPDRRLEEAVILERLKGGEAIEGFETIRVAKDGSPRRVALCIAPIRDASGQVVAGVKFARDITNSRSRSDEALILRASEAEHRAKNILATMTAMVRLSQGKSVGEFKEAIAGRIRALADVTSLTGLAGKKAAELRDIISNEFWSIDNKAVSAQVSLDGPAVHLTAEQAQGIAMITHELVTNSIKYGALSQASGRLTIEWTRAPDSVELRWIEAGGPQAGLPSKEGFGSRLIKSMAGQTLMGQSMFDWSAPGGLQFRLSFPIARSSSIDPGECD
jgi:PAS domain S-box-containing protein